MKNTRKMHRAKSTCQKYGNMEKATFGRPRYGKKNVQAGRSSDLVQKTLGHCDRENGTEIDELPQAQASGHKRVRQDSIEVRFVKTAGPQPGKQGIGRSKDK